MSGTTPTLTETVPDYRTVVLDKTTKFSYQKDPQDEAWYAALYAEPVASVLSAVPATTSGTPVTVVATAVLPDKSGVAFFLTGGTNGSTSTIRLAVTTPGGDTIYRTTTLDVADR